MKKIAFGFLWFLIIWFGTVIVSGAIVGGVAGYSSTHNNGAERGTGARSDKASEAGRRAGAEFNSKYENIILLGTALLAIGGTIAGVFPGTKSRKDKESE